MANNDNYTDELPSLDRTTTFGLGALFLASAAVLYGDATVSAFGRDLTAFLNTSLTTFGAEGAIEVTYAHVAMVASVVGAYVGNNAEIGEFGDHQSLAGYALIGSITLPMISGEFSAIVTDTTTRALVYTGIQTVAYISMVEAKEMADRGWV